MTPRLYDFRKYHRSRNISQNTFATRRLCEMRQTPNQNDQNTVNRATATIKRCPSDTEMIHLKSNGIQCYVTSLPGPARPPDPILIHNFYDATNAFVSFVFCQWGMGPPPESDSKNCQRTKLVSDARFERIWEFLLFQFSQELSHKLEQTMNGLFRSDLWWFYEFQIKWNCRRFPYNIYFHKI